MNTQSKKETYKISFFIAIILSIFVVHLPILYVLTTQFSDYNTLKAKQNTKKNLVMIDLKNMTSLPKRIADIDKPAVQKKPKKASAQALYNSSVKQETVSKRFSKKNIPLGTPKTAKKTQKNTHTAQKRTPIKTKQLKNKTAKSKIIKNQTVSKKPLTMQDKLKAIRFKQKDKEEKKYTKLFKNKKNTPSPTFKTNLGSPTGGNTGDYFPNYKVGNRTYLNTLANPNIRYFVELRRKFRFTFNPGPALRPRINQISKGQIAVVWGLSIDSNGNLRGLTLLRGSGIYAYDMEAKRTIKVSSPFSKPPVKMLQKDQMIHMAWTFVVYL